MDVPFVNLDTIKTPYDAFCNMLKPMDSNMPVFDHFFMLGEVLYDYEKDKSWFVRYMELMKEHAEIVKAATHSKVIKRKNAEDFIIYIKGFCPLLDQNGANNDNDVDMTHLDPMFEDAARLIVREQNGSTSLIQRKFAIGYNRAGRLMAQLEKAGVVGAAYGSKPREVLIKDDNSLENLLAMWR